MVGNRTLFLTLALLCMAGCVSVPPEGGPVQKPKEPIKAGPDFPVQVAIFPVNNEAGDADGAIILRALVKHKLEELGYRVQSLDETDQIIRDRTSVGPDVPVQVALANQDPKILTTWLGVDGILHGELLAFNRAKLTVYTRSQVKANFWLTDRKNPSFGKAGRIPTAVRSGAPQFLWPATWRAATSRPTSLISSAARRSRTRRSSSSMTHSRPFPAGSENPLFHPSRRKNAAAALVPVLEETNDHLMLKLAAFVFFHAQEPIVITSPQQHPALAGQDFAPDFMTADDTNRVTLWIQCGKTTLHKLGKATNRFRDARIWMLMAQPHEAKAMAQSLDSEGNDRIEVWSFQYGEFDRWRKFVKEQNDIIGEANETSMNLVINNEMFMTELTRCG